MPAWRRYAFAFALRSVCSGNIQPRLEDSTHMLGLDTTHKTSYFASGTLLSRHHRTPALRVGFFNISEAFSANTATAVQSKRNPHESYDLPL